MNWTPIVVSAAAGAISAALVAVVLKLMKRPQSGTAATILYAVVFALAIALSREIVTPRIQIAQMEEQLLSLNIYRTLKEHEPQAYQRIKAAIEEAVANRRPLSETFAVTRPIIGEVATKRLPHASDEALIRFARHVSNSLTILHGKGGTACFSYINPQPGEVLDFAALLGPEVTNRELDIVSEVVVSAAVKTRLAVSPAESEPALQAVIAKLRAKYTDPELASLDNVNTPNLDKRRYCEMLASLYGEASALPASDAARLIRHLMQS